jgi:hypothetical protein
MKTPGYKPASETLEKYMDLLERAEALAHLPVSSYITSS